MTVDVGMCYGGAEASSRAGSLPAQSALHIFAENPDLQEPGRAAAQSVAGIYSRVMAARLLR